MRPDAETLLRWAQQAGASALPAYGVALLLVWAAVAAAAWGVRRPGLRRSYGGLSAPVRLRLLFAVGTALVLAAGALFVEVAEGVVDAGTLFRADQAFADAVQANLPTPARQLFAAVTHLGDTRTLVLLCFAVALWLVLARRPALALGWVVAVAGNGALNSGLKLLFERARPLRADGQVLTDGFSFPSGHSSGSMVAYGMLAYLGLRLLPARWHLAGVLLAGTLALTVAASRLFLNVHFASDVLAGLASGTAWLTLCIVALETARARDA